MNQLALLLNPFCFCETEYLYFTTRVFGHSAISPFLGGYWNCSVSAKVEKFFKVPGLSIKNCARGCNNCDRTWSQSNVTDVTTKAFFESLYLALGLSSFEPRLNVPIQPHPHRSQQRYLSISGLTFICQHTIYQVSVLVPVRSDHPGISEIGTLHTYILHTTSHTTEAGGADDETCDEKFQI